MRKFLALLLCAAMLTGMLPAAVFADETEAMAETIPVEEEEIPIEVEELPAEEAPSPELPAEEEFDLPPEELTIEDAPDGDTRLNGFLRGWNRLPAYQSSSNLESRLSPREQLLYHAVKEMALQVAMGERTAARVQLAAGELNLPEERFTAEALGLESIYVSETNKTLSAEAKARLYEHVQLNVGKVYRAALRDCPFEMYWQGNSISSSLGVRSNTAGQVWFGGDVYIEFRVSPDFSMNGLEKTYNVDIAKTGAVCAAISSASGIVESLAGLSDMDKLNGYQNALCRLNSYNYTAADHYDNGYGNPWQIVYLFDGDPDTNVVCEGYAKGFQYLCELSSFSTELYVLCATGYLSTPTGRGLHMWNIVRMDNGGSYLVDVTNSDIGQVSSSRYFFTLPTDGSPEAGYSFGSTSFIYDSDSFLLYLPEELTLASESYSGPASALPPVIVCQPAAANAAVGGSAVFALTAQGEALTYCWQQCSPMGSWEDCTIPGWDTPELTIPAEASRSGWQFRCIVTDAYGRRLVSSAAELTVLPEIRLLTQPEDFTVTEGGPALFQVEATGSGLRYRWQWSADGRNWTYCTASTPGYNTALLQPSAAAFRNGYRYRCVITDLLGSEVISDIAVLTVRSLLRIDAQPLSQSVPEGSSARFTVEATGTEVRFRWQWNSGISGWQNCTAVTPGYNTDILRPIAAAARNGYRYRCILTDSDGSTMTTDAVTLTVLPSFQITEQPVSLSVPEGSPAQFAAACSGTVRSILWQWNNGVSGWQNCTAATPGYNTGILRPIAAASRNGYRYRCILTASDGTALISNEVTLTVLPALQITLQPADCTAELGSSGEFTVAAGGSGLHFRWQWNSGISGWQSCTAVTPGYNTDTLRPTATAARSGYRYRCVITDDYGNTLTSQSALLTVFTPLYITEQPADCTAEEGSSAEFTAAADGTGLHFRWQWNSGISGWQSCTAVTPGYNTDILRPIATAARNGYRYRCVITDSSGQTVTSEVARLTVK